MDLLSRRRTIMTARGEAVPIYCDYIAPSGSNALVDTGVYLQSDYCIEVNIYATASFGRRAIAGAYDGTYLTGIDFKSSGGARTWYGTYGGGATSNRNGGSLNSRLYCCLTPSKFFTPTITNVTNGGHVPNASFKLFTVGSYTSGSTLYIGPVYIYGADAKNATTKAELEAFTPVASFLPCTYKGKAGFWYVEQDTFLGNTGSGTLSAITL